MSLIRNSNTFNSGVAERNGSLNLNENIFNLIIISLRFRFYNIDFYTFSIQVNGHKPLHWEDPPLVERKAPHYDSFNI